MAEIFATASAAVGVAAAAGQLIDGIMKLNAFCTEIRDIPDEIQHAVGDLFMLIDMLESVRAELDQSSSLQEVELRASARVLAHLQHGSQHVGEVLLEMQEKVGKKKRWGRVRAVGMKRKLTQAVSRVQSVQRLLLMTLTTETRAMLRRGLDTQREGLLAISTAITTASISHEVTSRKRRHLVVAIDQNSHEMENKYSQDRDVVVRKANRRSFQATYSKSWTLRLRFPMWLLSQAWDLSVHQANQGWDFQLRSYNIRPSNANIFKAIEAQNFIEVRELLAGGKASIYDRSQNGKTILHYAARQCCKSEDAASIFEFLIKSGADINATDEKRRPVHRLLPFNDRSDTDSSQELRLVKCYRLLIFHPNWSNPAPGAIVGSDRYAKQDILALNLNPPSDVVSLILNDLWPPWNERSWRDRFRTLCYDSYKFPAAPCFSARTVRACFGYESLGRSFAQSDRQSQKMIFQTTSTVLAYGLAQGLDATVTGARQILKDIRIADNYSRLYVSGHGFSPIRTFIIAYCVSYYFREDARHAYDLYPRPRRQEDLFQEAIKQYLAEMMLQGIDVHALASSASKDLQTREMSAENGVFAKGFTFLFKHQHSELMIHAIGLNCGLAADECHLWLSNPLDECAGDFWDMLEHPERAMPGAWDDGQ